MGSKIIPGIYAEVLRDTSGAPVQDNALDIVGIMGTFARGPLQTPVGVSDPAQAALIFGSLDSSENASFMTGMWALQQVMAQGAKRVIVVRVGPALTASLDITDEITATSANGEAPGVAVVIETNENPIALGFIIGQSVVYGGGTGNQETAVITNLAVDSITATLVNNHNAGETLVQEAVVATISAPTPGTFGNLYTVKIEAGTDADTVKITLNGDSKQEVWDNLTNTPGTPRYLVDYLNTNSTLVSVTAGVSSNLPVFIPAIALFGGDNGNITSDADYIGAAGSPPTGLFVFDGQDINIVNCAGQSSAAVHTAMDVHAQEKGDRINVVGGTLDESVAATVARAAVLASDRTVLVFPGIKIFDPNVNDTVTMTSAYTASCVAGVIATLDPFKSPSNKQIIGLLGMEKDVNETDVATLIQGGVNAVTIKGRRGFRIRSGITTSIVAPFNQINIRRLFDQIVRGVTEGNEDLVSDPNNEDTWHALEQGITDFLDRLKSQGAIQQFFVKVFSTLADQKAGFLYADVGIFPTYAADFIVIRIKPNDTGSFNTSIVNQQ